MAHEPTKSKAERPQSPFNERSVALRVAPDVMSIQLDYPTPLDDLRPLVGYVRQELMRRGVPEEWLGDDLDRRINRAAAAGQPLRSVVIVEGQAPVSPVHGYVEWGGSFFSKGFVTDEKTGAIDYRKRTAQTSVEAGQLLATIIPPQPGKNGRDVFGRMVPSARGTWPTLRAGPNVSQHKEDLKFYALSSGRIRRDGMFLTVDDVYTVKGSVGIKTGHITHPGAVIIEGDIDPTSEVVARGDVEVYGVIERADVFVGGDLTVHGGITGRGKNAIRVAGNVHARFINEADLEVGGDVAADRDIRQSTIKARGMLNIEFGRVVGGNTTALGGILAGQTGSEALVPTSLTAGVDFRLQGQVDALKAQIESIVGQRERIHEAIASQDLPSSKLSEELQEAMAALHKQVGEYDKCVQELLLEIDRLKAESKALARPRIEISKRIFPESLLSIRSHRLKIKESLLGPLHALVLKGEIALKPGRLRWPTTKHGKSTPAQEMEKDEEDEEE